MIDQLLLIWKKNCVNYSLQCQDTSGAIMCFMSVCSQNHQNKEGCWLSCIFCLFFYVTKVLRQLVYLIHQKSFTIADQEWKVILS